MPVCVELFSGSGTVSSVFRSAGWRTFSIDIRKRKGVCEPDLRKNILEVHRLEIPFENVHVLWASPPCDVWSYASGSLHWKSREVPRSKKCLAHIEILKTCLQLIDEINPDRVFIENPRGRLRFYAPFVAWCKKRKLIERTITLSSYGFPTKKPTNIWTNFRAWRPKELASYGRGAKNPGGTLCNFSKCKSQKTPGQLAREILRFCEVDIHGEEKNNKEESNEKERIKEAATEAAERTLRKAGISCCTD